VAAGRSLRVREGGEFSAHNVNAVWRNDDGLTLMDINLEINRIPSPVEVKSIRRNFVSLILASAFSIEIYVRTNS